MNIGFYRYSLLNRGGDRIVVDYANYLATQGHEVTIHVREFATRFVINQSVRCNILNDRNRFIYLLATAGRKFEHDMTVVDIIHLPLLLLFRNKVLYLAQADDVEYYSSRILRAAVDACYRIYFSLGLPTISVSDHLSKILQERYHVTQLNTVNNGIDLEIFHPDPDSELIRSKQGRLAIFFLARGDKYRKGYDIADTIFAQLPEYLADKAELWVCGEQFFVNNSRLKVRNFGVVRDEELRRILSSCDIFFYPSRHEGFGLFPLEAMACGCAVVTSDAVPYSQIHAEILSSPVGNSAQLLGNLEILLSDLDMLRRCKAAGIVTARSYSNSRSREIFANTLASVVERRESPVRTGQDTDEIPS
ncbi:MAG: glycosyltransferase [Desulfuromonadales bacterium]|nr:MAG: glycosyltransferase [Desulfuromonadales bacterium]